MLAEMKPFLLAMTAIAFAQREGPQPKYVDPGDGTRPPADAVALSEWARKDGSPSRCQLAGGVIECMSGSGDIYSKEKFQSAQIHLEFNVPSMPEQKGQLRGNSGVYLQAKYEMQILDSYENPTYSHGSLGGLYGQSAPLVNAARKPEQWQSYDMIFHAPKCDPQGLVTQAADLTVLLNGVLVQDHVPVRASLLLGKGCEAGPLMLQDHSGFKNAPVTKMKFRNLWIRRLE